MKKKAIIISLIIVIVLALFFVVAAVLFRHVPQETYAVEEIDTEAHWGSISGSFGYPSDYIPEMGACAQSKDKEELYCTYDMVEDESFMYGLGYTIDVPPGSYYVFSHLIEEETKDIGFTSEDKAYYSKYVTCGMKVSCASHKAVAVKVERKQHIQDIDPIDWYNF